MCQVLAIQMTKDMLTSTKRYVRTQPTEGDALDILASECEGAIGAELTIGDKLPRLRSHVKTHKADKPKGMELRPTTDSRRKGAYVHNGILKRILDKATRWAMSKSDYTCLSPTNYRRTCPGSARQMSEDSSPRYPTNLSSSIWEGS